METQGTTFQLLKKYAAAGLITLVSAHLSTPIHFPLNSNYVFPFAHFSYTFISSIIVIHLIDLVYRKFEKTVFKNKIGTRQISLFILASLLAVCVYFPLYYLLGLKVLGYPFELYSLTLSLLSTLIVASLFIIMFYGQKFVLLLTVTNTKGSLKVKSGKQLHLIPLDEIRCFYSQHKNVYLVNQNGNKILTNFSLNELEGLLDKESFFRANRQYLIHKNGVSSITSASNSKLEVMLLEPLGIPSPISVSRYKAVEFKAWIDKIP